ncbi:MAG: stealth conserved region 3 domain-containing protein, partial [Kiritimatiellae bacterium]|nr:stealth conserved region 3 domain-containing protein [Kiritimatiellia bacterium]
GQMRYWFRGVEKFAPWVRKVHFITWGHRPRWLATEHPKLNVVKHTDYIPEKYLPTFSSHTIELNLHRIAGLAERFVYFNDDTFLAAPCTPDDFFKGPLPRDIAVEAPIQFLQGGVRAETQDMAVINRHFPKRRTMRRDFLKWWNLRYGMELFKTVLSLPYGRFLGFLTQHLPVAYRKETFKEVWQCEEQTLDATCRHRFRDLADVNQWLMQYWQLASGRFAPRGKGFGHCFEGAAQLDAACDALRRGRFKCVCWNDSPDIEDFADAQHKIAAAFDSILPEKSSFEL